MKKIKNLLSNVIVLAILLILGVVLIIFLSSRSQDNMTGQARDTTPPTTQNEKMPASKPNPGQKTPIPIVVTTEPEDDQPEPTWTPKVILPEGTPPLLPSPLPTFTPTPTNPKEEMIVSLDSRTGQLAISPDDQEIAFNQRGPDGKNQLWKLNLSEKQLTRLSNFGGIPEWSPDGKRIAFLRRYSADSEVRVEIRVVDSDGRNERVPINRERSEVLDFYWDSPRKINVVSPSGVDNVDLSDRITRQNDLSLPSRMKHGSSTRPPKTDGSSNSFIVLNEKPPLQIVPYTGSRTIITNPWGRDISDFSLSPDKKQIAYTTVDGRFQGLWVTNLTGSNQKKLFELPKGGNITTPRWSPDGKFLAVGHRPTGTYYGSSYELILVDVDRAHIIDLDVSEVSEGFTWSHDGKWLYYTRAILVEPPETYDVTLYRMGVGE